MTTKTPRVPVYETTWRNKFLTLEAATIDDMIATYEEVAAHFKAMKAAGITLDPQGGTGDDYARLVTHDAAVAKEFGLELEEYDDEVEDPDEEYEAYVADAAAADAAPVAPDAVAPSPRRGFEFL